MEERAVAYYREAQTCSEIRLASDKLSECTEQRSLVLDRLNSAYSPDDNYILLAELGRDRLPRFIRIGGKEFGVDTIINLANTRRCNAYASD
jgi:hypothetical protein